MSTADDHILSDQRPIADRAIVFKALDAIDVAAGHVDLTATMLDSFDLDEVDHICTATRHLLADIKALKAAAPKGIDVYFDNVGGDIFEACLFQMNNRGRIACCGAVSQYDGAASPTGPPITNRPVGLT